jgi:hypothetical protein
MWNEAIMAELEVLSLYLLGLRKTVKPLSQDIHCHGYPAPPEYNLETLQLEPTCLNETKCY